MTELEELKKQAAELAAKVAELEAEQRRAKFPMDVELFFSTSKHSNDELAGHMRLEGECANYFRYSGLEIHYKATILEDGTVIMHEIQEPKSKEWIKLPRSIKLNCA